MPTLLLRLVGPMQSWGVQSNFTHRDTGLEPSKSGVIGLICAALGRTRSEPIGDLAALKMGARVDREGIVLRDYHTAGKGGFLRAGGGVETGDVVLSDRYYLADAAFLVGFQSDDEILLKDIYDALQHPRWMLWLGRKAFAPGEPVWLRDGLQPHDLPGAMATYPRLRPTRRRDEDQRVRWVIEDNADGDVVRPDQPVSFANGHRKFTVRRVRVELHEPPAVPGV